VHDMVRICKMYQTLYPLKNIEVTAISTSFMKLKEINIYGEQLGTKGHRNRSCSYIMACWTGPNGNLGGISDTKPRPGQVLYYMVHKVFTDKKPITHVLACIKWFLPITDNTVKSHFGNPIEGWAADSFEDEGPSMFMPVQRIRSKYVHMTKVIHGRDIMFICPWERVFDY
jgi:hypothetical protein